MDSDRRVALLKERIREVEDFPKKGILFKDIFPLFMQPSLLEVVIDLFMEDINNNHLKEKPDVIMGLDARGFLFGPLLALKLSASFAPIRKKGKLPGSVVSQAYSLEYGENEIEMQTDVIKRGSKVVIVDDLLATGGTMAAACKLVEQQHCKIIACQCVIELLELKGTEKLPTDVPFYSIIKY